jgi:hypothetical protein
VKKFGIFSLKSLSFGLQPGFGQFLKIKDLGKFSKKLTRLVEFTQEKQKFPTLLFEKNHCL